MMKSLFIILAISLCISTNVAFGEDICSHYDDIDCIHPDITKLGHFINQWSVYLPGMTKEEAKEFLENHGFVYLGQVIIFFIRQSNLNIILYHIIQCLFCTYMYIGIGWCRLTSCD